MDVLALAEHVRAISDENGAVLLDIKNGSYYSTNRLGADICQLLKSGVARSVLVQEISNRFQVSNKIVGSDVERFLQDLRIRGMLK